MEQLAGFPFFPVAFNRAGQPVDPAAIAALREAIRGGGVSDLIVISHGWNNDMAEARDLYAAFFSAARRLIDRGALMPAPERRFAVVGVFWPSKRFAERELIPGGAAGLAGGGAGSAGLRRQLEGLEGVFDTADAAESLAAMAALVPRLEDSEQACAEFVALARQLLPAAEAGDGAEAGAAEAQEDDDSDGSGLFLTLAPGQVFARLQQPVDVTEAQGPEPEGAAGLGGAFSGVGAAARRVLNLTTYYQMKHRAGLVGAAGLNPVLRELQALQPGLRLHLIGHSFGARLVTAAVAGGELLPVQTLVLLQAAFSHYGLAQRWDGRQDGRFRRLLTERALAGPCLITHTANDTAVGLAYPLASLLAGQVAAGLGDANDRFGGMGRNGAQKTPEAIQGLLQSQGARYKFEAAKVHNLLADAHIQNHNDISGEAVVFAALTAMETCG